MLSLKRTEGKVALVLAILAVLFIYNSFNRSPRSRLQQEYDGWLVETEQSVRADLRAEKNPAKIEIRLRVPAPEGELLERRVELSTREDALRVIRLLQLIREANAFSRGIEALGSQSTEIEVRSADQSFAGRLTGDDLIQNVQAQTFMTLFDLYSNEQTAKLKLAQSETKDEPKPE